jgi:hypothetical protein
MKCRDIVNLKTMDIYLDPTVKKLVWSKILHWNAEYFEPCCLNIIKTMDSGKVCEEMRERASGSTTLELIEKKLTITQLQRIIL